MVRRFLILVATAIIFNIPAAMFSESRSGSTGYDVAAAIAQAIGSAMMPFALGSIVLLAARRKPSGGLAPAIFVVALVSAFSFYGQYRLASDF